MGRGASAIWMPSVRVNTFLTAFVLRLNAGGIRAIRQGSSEARANTPGSSRLRSDLGRGRSNSVRWKRYAEDKRLRPTPGRHHETS